MPPVVELATLEIQSSAYRALLELEALGCDLSRNPSGRIVASFLNKGLCHLMSVLEDLKSCATPPSLSEFSDRFRQAFVKLQSVYSRVCARVSLTISYPFRRMGNILYCLFRRGSETSLPAGAALVLREANPAYRIALLDRLADVLRDMFRNLRTACSQCDLIDSLPKGPVFLGPSAARFVVQANTETGVLVMRFDDGHQELFNLTEAEWILILPLLASTHELGHAALSRRPQGALTRHDANGDEIAGDMKRLKAYIHPVGKGRGGNGMYYLAPYPRRQNVVD